MVLIWNTGNGKLLNFLRGSTSPLWFGAQKGWLERKREVCVDWEHRVLRVFGSSVKCWTTPKCNVLSNIKVKKWFFWRLVWGSRSEFNDGGTFSKRFVESIDKKQTNFSYGLWQDNMKWHRKDKNTDIETWIRWILFRCTVVESKGRRPYHGPCVTRELRLSHLLTYFLLWPKMSIAHLESLSDILL